MHAKNFKDLTGMKFGYYEVLKLGDPQITSNGKKRTMWTCRCICGAIKDVYAGHLQSRPEISCGCMKRTTLDNLTGSVFNYIRVDSRAEDTPCGTKGKKRTNWNCTCLACGKKFVLDAWNIKSGNQKSCGCMNGYFISLSKLHDYTGMTVGRLFVDSRAEDYIKPSGKKEPQWNCVCECGNKCIKSTGYLRTSPYASCGCWKSEQTSIRKTRNIIGELFGYALVLKKIETKRTSGGNYKTMYSCKCLNCCSVFETSANSLLNGMCKSCGCIKSYGEMTVREILRRKKIKYKTQYSFKDLYYSNKDHPLMFDFAIFNEDNQLQFLIEYQGMQHYKETDKDGTYGKLQREITDRLKKEYCIAHNITLYEIRYDEVIPEAINRILTTHANFVPSSGKTEKV